MSTKEQDINTSQYLEEYGVISNSQWKKLAAKQFNEAYAKKKIKKPETRKLKILDERVDKLSKSKLTKAEIVVLLGAGVIGI